MLPFILLGQKGFLAIESTEIVDIAIHGRCLLFRLYAHFDLAVYELIVQSIARIFDIWLFKRHRSVIILRILLRLLTNLRVIKRRLHFFLHPNHDLIRL